MSTMTQMAELQGQLWSARAKDWGEIIEGLQGWGIPLYRRVLEATGVGPGTSVLDVGCGAGRFCRMAADRGATVAGIDAAPGLIAIAKERTPEGDLRVGDMEALPWDDDSFDLVTGFSSFQFAANPVGALREARRVAKPGRRVVAAVPGRPEDNELAAFLTAIAPLMPAPPPDTRSSGPLALSEEGWLEAVVGQAGLEPKETAEVDCPLEFPDQQTMVRGLLSAGPVALAIRSAGEKAVRRAAIESLAPYRNVAGGYRLENRFRYVMGVA